jgi:ferrous iron transport protein A
LNTEYLTRIKKGLSGTINELPEGERARQKLSEMGLRVGMDITVTQVMPMSGPVIIKSGQTQIAIGHGMASRIKVKLK